MGILEHIYHLHNVKHKKKPGKIAIATAANGWEENCYHITEIIDFANRYQNNYDVYVSQNRFKNWRTATKLWQLNACYVDLDLYGSSPDLVLEEITSYCDDKDLPLPTLILYSGNGYHLIWRHTYLPRQALPRWRACQNELYKHFLDWKADKYALDCARVLRLANTRNSKTDRLAQILYLNDKVIYHFDSFAEQVLPFTRKELSNNKTNSKARKKAKKKENANKFSLQTLQVARLSDLQLLRKLRYGENGALPSRQRDIWIFFASVCMSYLVDPWNLDREIAALAVEATNGKWDERMAIKQMGSVIRRTEKALTGEKVIYRKYKYDPRYRLSNEKIIDWLNVSWIEQRQMQSIISREVKNERLVQKRREAGIKPREEYLSESSNRKDHAIKMAAEGYTHQQIADSIGVSRQAISYYLKKW